LPALAAYALARSGELAEAVEALEANRTRLAAEVQERDRRDLERLAEIGHADLYERYRVAADRVLELEKTELREQHPRRNRDFAASVWTAREELEAVVAAIRQIPGYQDFLSLLRLEQIQKTLTTPFSTGTRAAGVYLVVTSAGGVALIVHSSGVEPVWLEVNEEELNYQLVQRRAKKIVGGYLGVQLQPHRLETTLKDLQPWLGTKLMARVAVALMDLMPAEKENGAAPRSVYLVPSGRLAILPLHAATYEINGKTRTFLDDFVVAYAPSARTLRYSQQSLASASSGPADLFAVGNPLPLPDDVEPLKFAKLEVEEIIPLFGERARPLYENKATRRRVEKYLNSARYLHLACHGLFEPRDPLASGLVLSMGKRLTLRELLAGPGFHATRLAVLSACQTAIADFKNLPEEAIGLPAGFLQVGVPGVIGSLWPVDDLSTMLLMVKFYEYHLCGEPNNKTGPLPPASALRQAQIWLRDATKEHLSKLFSEYMETARDRPRMAYATARKYFSRYALTARQTPPFENAIHWAAFAFYGS
jgi:CHAT domain-containing protein